MKIAIINNLYKPYQKGGAENFCETIINEIKPYNHDCFIISTKPKTEKKINQEPRTYYINSNYYFLNRQTILYRFFWQVANIFNFGRAYKLKEILNKEKPDIIISNNLMGIGLRTFRIIKKTGAKHIHILHDTQLFFPSGLIIQGQEKKVNSIIAKIYQTISRFMITSPDLLVSPSQWLLSEHTTRKYFQSSKKIVRKNPIILNKEQNIVRDISSTIINFLFIGQIEKHKGIIFLIETFKKINNPNLRLKIIGNGSLTDKTKKMITNDNQISFLEFNKEIENEELKQAHCLIVPSLCYENSPTVIYKALNFNLPIIASKIGGIPELFNKRQGLLFIPNNGLDLIEKIEYFSNNRSLFNYEKQKTVETVYWEELLKDIN